MTFKDIKKGDRIVEREMGMEFFSTVKTEPIYNSNKWFFTSIGPNGEEVQYMQTQGLEHYGPRLEVL